MTLLLSSLPRPAAPQAPRQAVAAPSAPQVPVARPALVGAQASVVAGVGPGQAVIASVPAAVAAPAAGASAGGRVKASPLAKKIAAQAGVDLRLIQGSGPGGRIIRRDVEAAGSGAGAVAMPAAAPAAVAGGGVWGGPPPPNPAAVAAPLAPFHAPGPHFFLTRGGAGPRRAGTQPQAARPGAVRRDLLDLEPRHVRRRRVFRDHQSTGGRDPGGRVRPARAGGGRDRARRRPADDADDLVRSPRDGRRDGRQVPPGRQAPARRAPAAPRLARWRPTSSTSRLSAPGRAAMSRRSAVPSSVSRSRRSKTIARAAWA